MKWQKLREGGGRIEDRERACGGVRSSFIFLRQKTKLTTTSAAAAITQSKSQLEQNKLSEQILSIFTA